MDSSGIIPILSQTVADQALFWVMTHIHVPCNWRPSNRYVTSLVPYFHYFLNPR